MGKWADELTAKDPGREIKLFYPMGDQEKVATYPELSDEAWPMVLVVDDDEECRRLI